MGGDAPRPILESLLEAAVAAVEGGAAVRSVLGARSGQLTIGGEGVAAGAPIRLLAVGKAAAAMADAAEEWAGDRLRSGLVITKDGHGRELRACALRECAHPIPDSRNEAAAREVQRFLSDAAPEEGLIVLLSGGASALLACPVEGLTLEDLRGTTAELLACGADIHEVNAVRKHLSALAGGRAARLGRAGRTWLLAISDVPGDALEVIGSGPWTADSSTFADALAVIDRYGLRASIAAGALEYLEAGHRGLHAETPKPGDSGTAAVHARVVACSDDAVRAAEMRARSLGLVPIALGSVLRGEARVVGRRLAALARAVESPNATCLIASGETTVTLRGDGLGGRNQELALAAAIELARHGEGRPVGILAAGTDGTDGPTEAAGAFVDRSTVARGDGAGLDADRSLAANDSHRFLSAEGGLLTTGPTATNVMDLALVWIGSA